MNNSLPVEKRMMRAVVTDEHGTVLVDKARSGGSNNIAELWAVAEAFGWAKANGVGELELFTDSQNNFAWVEGRFGSKLNDRDAADFLYQIIKKFREKHGIKLEMKRVPREQNVAGIFIEQTYGI